jgi:hypothetical protein
VEVVGRNCATGVKVLGGQLAVLLEGRVDQPEGRWTLAACTGPGGGRRLELSQTKYKQFYAKTSNINVFLVCSNPKPRPSRPIGGVFSACMRSLWGEMGI